MADYDEYEPYKLFVSRIPAKWTEKLMLEHFGDLGFGEVSRVELFAAAKRDTRPEKTRRGFGNICYAFKNDGHCAKGDDCPFSHDIEEEEEPTKKAFFGIGASASVDATPAVEHTGNGCVVFHTELGMSKALEHSTIHVSHKSIKLRPWSSLEDGRDTESCYAWTKGNCAHGDDCKFSHDGPGACIAVGEAYKGRKFQCMSWKKKGTCSKGEICMFLHTDATKAIKKAKVEKPEAAEDASSAKKKGVCDNYKKKGKCRKGDKCPYAHDTGTGAGVGDKAQKDKDTFQPCLTRKRKITGAFLVDARKARLNTVTKFDEE